MKHTKFIVTLLFIAGLGIITSSAQQGVVSAGGEATGSGGTMSFSTGQTDFLYFSSDAGSIQLRKFRQSLFQGLSQSYHR